jgi:predicted transcriptional regulator
MEESIQVWRLARLMKLSARRIDDMAGISRGRASEILSELEGDEPPS